MVSLDVRWVDFPGSLSSFNSEICREPPRFWAEEFRICLRILAGEGCCLGQHSLHSLKQKWPELKMSGRIAIGLPSPHEYCRQVGPPFA